MLPVWRDDGACTLMPSKPKPPGRIVPMTGARIRRRFIEASLTPEGKELAKISREIGRAKTPAALKRALEKKEALIERIRLKGNKEPPTGSGRGRQE